MEPLKVPLHGKIPSNGISLSPPHPAQWGILICRSFLHNILQNCEFLLRQLLIPNLKLHTHEGGEHIQIGTRLHLSDSLVGLLKSGRINNRLLCEIATHELH